jgi:hypothetical protein
MVKKMVFVMMFGLLVHSAKPASLPPPFILKLLIKQAAGIIQNSEMIVSNTGKQLKLRMSKKYEIFNKKGKSVLKGNAKEIDISDLPKGKYTIKFDGDAAQVESFDKE